MDGDRIITVRPQGRFKADNGTALAAAALAGLGIAWIPDGITREHLASGALVPVLTRYPPPPAGVYVIRPPGHLPAWKIRVLIDRLIACFGQVSMPNPVDAEVGTERSSALLVQKGRRARSG